MVKEFVTNENGKIEFTEKELGKLLTEVWLDGNRNSYERNTKYWWTSPYSITAAPHVSVASTKTDGGE